MAVVAFNVPSVPNSQILQRIMREIGATQFTVTEEAPLTPHERLRQVVRRQPLTPEEREAALKVVAAGGDGQSITDPVAWQREIRQDRPLPFRD